MCIRVRCSASSSIQPTMSTSRLLASWMTAVTSPCASRLRRSAMAVSGLLTGRMLLTGSFSHADRQVGSRDPTRMQPRIHAVGGYKFGMRAILHDPARVENEHAVSYTHLRAHET